MYQNMRQVGAPTSQTSQLPTGLQLGTGVKVMGTEKLHMQGNIEPTGNQLDLAINGRGFFKSRCLMDQQLIHVMVS